MMEELNALQTPNPGVSDVAPSPEDIAMRANAGPDPSLPPVETIDPAILEQYGHLLPPDPTQPAPVLTETAPTVEETPVEAPAAPTPQDDPRLALALEQNAQLVQLLQRQMQDGRPRHEAPPPPADPAAEEAAILAEMARVILPNGKQLDQSDPAHILAYMTFRDRKIQEQRQAQVLKQYEERLAQLDQYRAQQEQAGRMAQAVSAVEPNTAAALKPYGAIPPHLASDINRIAAEYVAQGYDLRASVKAAVDYHKPTLEWAKSLQAKAAPPAPAPNGAPNLRAVPPASRDAQGRFAQQSAADRALGTRGGQPVKPSVKKVDPETIASLWKESIRRQG